MCARKWTPEEDAVVREAGSKYGKEWAGWSEALPDRSLSAIEQRRAALGVTGRWSRKRAAKREWTEGQSVALLKCVRLMMQATGHTPEECIRQFKRLKRERARGAL